MILRRAATAPPQVHDGPQGRGQFLPHHLMQEALQPPLITLPSDRILLPSFRDGLHVIHYFHQQVSATIGETTVSVIGAPSKFDRFPELRAISPPSKQFGAVVFPDKLNGTVLITSAHTLSGFWTSRRYHCTTELA